jgi:hypothetical protein
MLTAATRSVTSLAAPNHSVISPSGKKRGRPGENPADCPVGSPDPVLQLEVLEAAANVIARPSSRIAASICAGDRSPGSHIQS